MSNLSNKNLDKLTEVPTFSTFQADFDALLQSTNQDSGTFSLAMVDIDFFFKINEKHGSGAGDQVLKTVADHLVKTVGGSGEVYRYGGDEFTILMPGIEKEGAFLIMEQSRKDFGEDHSVIVGGMEKTLKIGISIGVGSFPDDSTRGQELIRKVSDALHRAKTGGRNKVSLAREERMVTKTSHYTQGQLERLSGLAKKEGVGEAVLLREAMDDLLRKYTF